MTVSDGECTVTFTDILIGDVYFAGGQSNMEMTLSITKDGSRYIREADDPMIRFCNFPVQAVLDAETIEQSIPCDGMCFSRGRTPQCARPRFTLLISFEKKSMFP